MPTAVIVTGSRSWKDRAAIRKWIGSLPAHSVVIHGACHLGGADIIADTIATAAGHEVKQFPADDSYGPWPGRGPKRNARMVQELLDYKAKGYKTYVLAFPLGEGKSGTRNCMEQARAAGFYVINCSEPSS